MLFKMYSLRKFNVGNERRDYSVIISLKNQTYIYMYICLCEYNFFSRNFLILNLT